MTTQGLSAALHKYNAAAPRNSYPLAKLRKTLLVPMAIPRETTPENRTGRYSAPRHASKKMPYSAFPNGWAHMEPVMITAITFPIRFPGVSLWTKAIICTEKTVENNITIKQQIMMII